MMSHEYKLPDAAHLLHPIYLTAPHALGLSSHKPIM